MKLYLAGNFPIMGSKPNEKEFRNFIKDDYYRLCAFFYEKEANNLMDLKEEELNGEGKITKRPRKRKSRSRKQRHS